MDLHKMQYFKDVYELNSFTKAANKNFVYQSAVTQQIASIEKELGVLLFEREHGKITHTQAGKIFYQECRDILDEYEHVLEEIKNHSSHKVQIQKKLKIGFSGVMENNFIMLINEYMCRYPEVRIDFIEGSYMSLCEKLVSQEIDIIFGVACELENIPGTVWKVLFTENQKILLSRMNELAEKDVLSMDELGSQTLIVPSKDMMPSCHKKGMQLCKKTKYRMNIDFVDSFEASKGLKKNFGALKVLDGISFELEEGQILAVIGPSGTGKSTLLRCMNYLEKPTEGVITIDDITLEAAKAKKEDIYLLRSHTAMVFQNYNLFKNKTALENIMEPMVSVQGIPSQQARERALEILKAIGLTEKENHYPSQLSGGQQQRIGIGRAMAVKPKVMLIDEPTSSLDPELVGEVLDLLFKLARQHTTMIIATHEMEFARHIADHVIFIEEGKIVEEGEPGSFFDSPKTKRAKQFLKKFEVKRD